MDPYMAGRGFQKPKVYDPSHAERAGMHFGASSARRTDASHVAKLRGDLGLDEADSPSGARPALELEEKYRELADQLEDLRIKEAACKSELALAQANEQKTQQKLHSVQQVSRSQSALMRAELGKCRRRLAHMQAVAVRLRQQAEWLQGHSTAPLPPELQTLPSEEEAAEENAELVQLHERWEKDVVQLQAELHGMPPPTTSPGASPSPPVVPSPRDVSQREAELEAEAKKHRTMAEKMARELKKLKDREAAAGNAAGGANGAGTAAAAGAAAAAAGDASAAEVAALRKDLEAADEKSKDSAKKVKQLAQAYKKLQDEKQDAEARCNELLQKSSQAPARKPLPPALVGRVRSALQASRQELGQLKAAVFAEMQQQLPQLMQQAIQAQLPSIESAMEERVKEWKDKWAAECDKRRKLHNLVQELRGNIRVYCRVRPLNERENGSCISFPAEGEIQIKNEASSVKKAFSFNQVFRENSTQAQVFAEIRDLVVSMIDGYNVCIFAYGQTGAGKTHSMQGYGNDRGVYYRTFCELFKVAAERKGWTIELKCALVEIYNEEIRDLLCDPSKKKEKLQVRQSKEGNFVPGLTMQPVANADEVDNILATGSANRQMASTDMNALSSRSHLLVQIYGNVTNTEGKKLPQSCITLVDLAGSERLAKSGVEGDRAKEAIAINKSLSALGDVINARATKNSHAPFRNSPLTHMLQDSLSGDSKTLMLLQINPCKDYVEESMCSLQFGARVNNVEMKSGK